MTIALRPDDVLIVVDMQNDFLPGGALAVAGGNEIVSPINALAARFANVVLTQDWHTPGHASFASSHRGSQPFSRIEMAYGSQVLWPDHCVMGTPGADFAPGLAIPHAQLVLRKGYNRGVDSYSGFREADRTTQTGLAGYLRERNLERVFVVGLATDFCVAWTALDARAAGHETLLIEDVTRAIDADGSLAAAHADLDTARVRRIVTADIG